MRSLSVLCALAVVSAASAQTNFRFIVTGDGRWDTKGGRAGDENGVNAAGMKRWIAAVIKEKPALLLYSGDLVGGTKSDAAELSQFETWMGVMQPVYDAGIKVLTCRGNHESHCQNPDAVWREVFSGAHANPGTSAPGEEQETYAFRYGNSVFLALDQFHGAKQPEINQTWLNEQLAQAKGSHIFPFMHKMAFRVGEHNDGMEIIPEQREKFMHSLVDAGCHILFCGHDHLYDHTVLTKAGWPATRAINQIVAGAAGAPFYTGDDHGGNNGDWTLEAKEHVEHKLGYCVVDVAGKRVTVTFKAESTPGVFTPVESFSWTE